VRKSSAALKETHILRWKNGQVLGIVPANNKFGEQLVVHRADLHSALLEKALEMPNFQLRLESTVVGVDLSSATATLSTGQQVQGDVLLGADGIKSLVRKHILTNGPDVAIPTGDAAFRVMLHRDQLMNDEELRPFIEEAKATRWIGPGRHVVAYPVCNHQLYNIVLVHPDRGGVDESWTKVGSKSNLLDEYRGWDSRLVKMLSLIPDKEVLEWKLCSHSPLSSWVSGKCALLGDACHPML
jgi:salicylate hydroxylase